jgi:hypothetical protein
VIVDTGQLVHRVDQLTDHVGHWPPSRWKQASTLGDRSRADVVHALVQQLADLEAQLTGRPIQSVPRLENDLSLPDQVRVMALDLLSAGAGPAVLSAAVDALTQARRQL